PASEPRRACTRRGKMTTPRPLPRAGRVRRSANLRRLRLRAPPRPAAEVAARRPRRRRSSARRFRLRSRLPFTGPNDMRRRTNSHSGRSVLTRRTVAIGALSILLTGAGATTRAAADDVDVQLVLAVDASGSVDMHRFELQKRGYAAAFRN